MAAIAELERLTTVGPAVIVGTCDNDGIPEVSRGWGVRFSAIENTLDVCLYAGQGQRTLANLVGNPQAAITVVAPNTYRGLQVKGRVIWTAAADLEDASRVAAHKHAFIEAVGQVGLTEEMVRRLYSTEMGEAAELVNVRIQVDDLFDQTPGPGAGARL